MLLALIYHSIFPNIKAGHFRDLVLCRIIYPGSKLRTVVYLSRHFNKSVSEQTIYRAMDQLDDQLKENVEACTFNRTKQYSEPGSLNLVFYDMTILYFETESEDDLRKIGYSKDSKHQHPQIMIGLLVNTAGYPISDDVFEGNKSETKTLIPIIEGLIDRFSIHKPIIVTDAALLSKDNLQALQANGYPYIVGRMNKNEKSTSKTASLR